MRVIASGIGRGHVSSSSVHNLFRGPRVPRWSFLELVVKELHGNPAEFHALWQAARLAEGTIEAHSDLPHTNPLGQEPAESVPHPAMRIWSSEIPARNRDFTGRVAELRALNANLSSYESKTPAPQVISGIGGVGKTEIATEFIHRHRDRYEVIWWIRAEHHDRVREALVKLGQRLSLRPAATGGDRNRTITATLEALESGHVSSWLLVYDNAAQPLDLQRYLPACLPRGHVIITSRLQDWPGFMDVDSIQVSPFTQEEAISFLRRRVPHLAPVGGPRGEDTRADKQAGRLVDVLGHLPIAIEHAAAYLAETGQTVDDYLRRFEENPHMGPGDQVSAFPAQVTATWLMSAGLLTADAEQLFNLCAFFSPEPIAAELFLRNPHAVSEPAGMGDFLSSPARFRAAASQLDRLSLAKVDGARDRIQMHRVVQAVARGQLQDHHPDLFRSYRAAVEALLAESNPGNPDRGINDAAYDLSLQHLESDRGFLSTANPALRRLIIDQVRRLHLRGGHVEAVQFGQDVLRVWRDRLGPHDLQVLTLAVEVAIALRLDGHAADARLLTLETLTLLRQHYGEQHEVALLCANDYGAYLRARGQFGEALELDKGLLPKFQLVFGPDHARTLNVQNNLAEDYRRLGRFQEALNIDRRTFEGRLGILGPNDLRTLFSHDAVARDLRGLGRYRESLDIARTVVGAFAAASGRETWDRLYASTGFAAALRKAGHYWEALRESEDVVQRYRDYLGPDHLETLRAAANLINDRRAVGDLARAEELGHEVYDACREAGFPFDIGYATLVNLASVLRADGHADEARKYDLQARDGLIDAYGDLHPFTLAARINYAADLALCDELAEAIRIGQAALADCRVSLGAEHPDTLIAASNLAIDLAAAGDRVQAERLLAGVLRVYEDTLTADHPVARAAAQRTRLSAEIELY